jgi:hypothetical protein
MRATIAVVLGVQVALTATASGQGSNVDPNQRYLLLSTQRTATMDAELNEAAAKGYRVVTASPTTGSEMLLFLEHLASPPDTYVYRLLATTRISTMERELNQVAIDGYRLLPQTIMLKGQAGSRLLGGGERDLELVLVAERSPKTDVRYEYRLLGTERTGTMQKEVSDAVASGFVVVGMASRDQHVVILERERREPLR